MTVLSFSLFSEEYSFGGKNGWSKVSVRNGITTGKGRFGSESLVLDTNDLKKDDATDLLLSFENGKIEDKTGNYEVKQNSLFLTENSIKGKGAAISRNRNGGLVLSGKDGTFFNTSGPAGSFAVDFWINPAVTENGEKLLTWRSSRNISGKIVYQLISATFYNSRLLFNFANIFDGSEKMDVSLMSSRKIVPDKWSHHSLEFNEDSGAFTYKIDGELEDIKFITDTGHEGGSVFQAVIGVGADLELCPSYTGMIDDFRILRSWESGEDVEKAENAEALKPSKYALSGGHFESEPVLTKAGTIFQELSAEVSIPEETAVQFYIRTGENCYNWTKNFPEWIPVKNGQKLENLTGLYFQVAADLFTDGSGNKTPSVSQINVKYQTLPEPQPPYKVSASKGDGSVTLSWSISVDDTAGGYYIYYGNRSGEYLGRYALQGDSPIDAGNATTFTISGLKNGTIYYFAISAYSKLDNRICGPLSKEVYARPGVSDGR